MLRKNITVVHLESKQKHWDIFQDQSVQVYLSVQVLQGHIWLFDKCSAEVMYLSSCNTDLNCLNVLVWFRNRLYFSHFSHFLSFIRTLEVSLTHITSKLNMTGQNLRAVTALVVFRHTCSCVHPIRSWWSDAQRRSCSACGDAAVSRLPLVSGSFQQLCLCHGVSRFEGPHSPPLCCSWVCLNGAFDRQSLNGPGPAQNRGARVTAHTPGRYGSPRATSPNKSHSVLTVIGNYSILSTLCIHKEEEDEDERESVMHIHTLKNKGAIEELICLNGSIKNL